MKKLRLTLLSALSVLLFTLAHATPESYDPILFDGVEGFLSPAGSILKITSSGLTLWNLLPYDAEVAYLESDGASYIDTGLTTTRDRNGFGFDCTVSLNPSKQNFDAFSINVVSSTSAAKLHLQTGSYRYINIAWHGGTKQIRVNYGSLNYKNPLRVFIDESGNYTVETTAGTFTGTITASSSYSYPGHIGLFGMFYTSVNLIDTAGGRIHHCRFFKEGDFDIDLIPVRIGNEGCMYDRNSGTFYHNAGTGSFICGPDK